MPPPQNKFRVKIKKEKEKKRGTMKTARRTKIVERCLSKSPPPAEEEEKEFWAKWEPMNKFSAKLEEEEEKNEKNKKRDDDKDAKKWRKSTHGHTWAWVGRVALPPS